ncbi:hypothetical protein ACHAXR_013333 [Thalassiosira sp. AJA248-18]
MIYPLILLLLFDKTIAIMTATAITGIMGASSPAFALIPSQVPDARHGIPKKERSVLHAHAEENDVDSMTGGDKVVYSPTMPSPSDAPSIASSSGSSKNNDNHKKKKLPLPRKGNLPDVHWRAISMTHLRSHPNFQPLPPPSMINALPTKEHVRYFRQDSWQWDYLHTGRCTTSQAASALGFLEPKAARFLGIPRSLQRGGTSAWDRLRQAPEDDQSLDAMEQILCEGRSSALDNEDEVVGSWRPGAKESDRLWVPASRLRASPTRTKPFPFAAKYIPALTYDELYQRRLYLDQHHLSPSPMKTRMQWGNAQEATSILTALNYFCGEDSKTTIHETGMCGAGFDDAIDDPLQGVKIGASPDALICHGNGTVEILEVKNHCPFVWNRISPHYAKTKNRHSNRKNKKGKKHKKKKDAQQIESGNADEDQKIDHQRNETGIPKHYVIRDFQLERKIPPVYIPQLMMEMLCVGDAVNLDETKSSSTPVCTSAIMVRQTATKGAILLRLQRDEEWIQEMKYWLGKFQVQYVETGTIPPDNFFYEHDPNSRYNKFLQRTKELSECVEQVAFVDHGRIQRMVLERGVGGEVPLFLDRIDMGRDDGN